MARKSKIIFLFSFGLIFLGQLFLIPIASAQITGNRTTQSAPCPPPADNLGSIVQICSGYEECANKAASGNKDAIRCWTDYGIFSGDPQKNPVSPACFACGLCDVCDLAAGASGILYWVFFFIGVTILIVVIIGGAFYLFSGGDPAKAKKGRDILKYTGLSIIIILGAYVIVAYLLYFLTGGKTGPKGQSTVSNTEFLTAWFAPCKNRPARFYTAPSDENNQRPIQEHIKALDAAIVCYKYPLINTSGQPAGEVYKFCPPPLGEKGVGGCGFTVNPFNHDICYRDSARNEFCTKTPACQTDAAGNTTNEPCTSYRKPPPKP